MSTENKKKKNKRKQANFYIVFIVTMCLFAAIRHGFALEIPMNQTSHETVMTLSLEAPQLETSAMAINAAENNTEDEELYNDIPDSLMEGTENHETTVNSPEGLSQQMRLPNPKTHTVSEECGVMWNASPTFRTCRLSLLQRMASSQSGTEMRQRSWSSDANW